MHRRRLAMAVVLALSFASFGRTEDAEIDPGPIVLQAVSLPGVPEALSFGDEPISLRRLRIRLTDGQWLRLVECASELCAESVPRGPMPSRLPENGAPGTHLTKGSDPFIEVWLADGVERAGTGVLPGPGAASISARDRAGRVHRLDLPVDRAIEDVEPRLADVDGDGQDEIVVVMTREMQGAALAIVTLRPDGLTILAEGAPAPQGVWRDPVAIADLDGDGGPEIATVTSGDDEGRLDIWRLVDGTLTPIVGMKGFSTHVPGTRNVGMAAVADMDGDKIVDLVLPSLDRRSLRVISLAGGAAAEPYRVDLAAAVVTRIAAYAIEGRQRPIVAAGLSDSTLVILR